MQKLSVSTVLGAIFVVFVLGFFVSDRLPNEGYKLGTVPNKKVVRAIRPVVGTMFKTKYEIDRQTEAALSSRDLNKVELGIRIGTYGRVNNCQLKLVIAGQYESEVVSCAGLKNNDLNYFRFEQLPELSSGDQDIVLVKLDANPANDVAVFAHPQRDDENVNWIEIVRRAKKVTRSILVYRTFDFKRFFILGFIVIALILALFGKLSLNRNVEAVLPLFCLLISVYLMSPFFGGFDETAHITNLRQAHADINPQLNSVYPQKIFYNDVRKIMIEEGFKNYHGINVPLNEKCPHWVLRYCGTEKDLESYYSVFASLIHLFDSDPRPSTYLYFFWFFNLVLIALVFIFVPALAGRDVAPLFFLVFPLWGTFLMQLPSITNDVLVFAMTILMTGIYLQYLQGRGVTKLGYIIGSILFLIGLALVTIESSFVLFLVLIPIPFVLSFLSRVRPSKQIKKRISFALLVFVPTLGLIALPYYGDHVLSVSKWLSAELNVREISNLTNHIESLSFSLRDVFRAFQMYFSNVHGAAIWGRFNYGEITTGLGVGCLITFILLGVLSVSASSKKSMSELLLLSAAFSFCILCPVVLALLFFETHLFESFTAARLTAPVMALPLAFSVIGAKKLVAFLGGNAIFARIVSAYVLWLILVCMTEMFIFHKYFLFF